MPSVEDLKNYYKSFLEKKVFFDKKTVSGSTFYIMYLHDKSKEINYFVETFSQYFPYYIWNEDQLETLNPTISIGDALKCASKRCWKTSIVPSRKVKANGIFGELFLDFYERIVHDRKLITTYASRRAYKDSTESRGYDHIGYILNGDKLEIVLGEAKYVTNAYVANSSLQDDIKWVSKKKPGHLSKEYFNDFLDFIVNQNNQFSKKEKDELRVLMSDLNSLLVNGGKTFLQYIIENDIKLNVVLFAIFSDQRENPLVFKNYYDNLYQETQNAISKMGITNYAIEIVFIPTKEKSMKIKEKIHDFFI